MNTAASAFEELYESAATMVPTGDLVYLPNNPYTPQQLFFINTAQVDLYIINFFCKNDVFTEIFQLDCL